MSDAPVAAANPAPTASEPPKTPAPPSKVSPDSKVEAKPEALVEKPAPRLHKFKANGREMEVDLNNTDDIVRRLSAYEGIKSATEETVRARKELMPMLELKEALTSGDVNAKRQALRQLLGGDDSSLKQLALAEAREMYEKEKQLSGMSETERRLAAEKEEAHSRLRQYEEREEQQKQLQAQQEMQATIEGYRQKLGGIAVSALQEIGGPESLRPVVLRGLIPYLQAAESAGIDLDPKLLAQEYTADIRSQFHEMANALEGDALAKWLGEGVVKKLGLYHVAKLRGSNGASPGGVQQAQTNTSSEDELTKLKRMAGYRNL